MISHLSFKSSFLQSAFSDDSCYFVDRLFWLEVEERSTKSHE